MPDEQHMIVNEGESCQKTVFYWHSARVVEKENGFAVVVDCQTEDNYIATCEFIFGEKRWADGHLNMRLMLAAR